MPAPLLVKIFSFSYHGSGIPEDKSGNGGGFVFDCRTLPNPGREEEYAALTGKDPEVIEYLERHSAVKRFLEYVCGIVDLAVINYQNRGFKNLMVSFGCTGGQHRSVYCAEQLAAHLTRNTVSIEVHHTDLG